MRIWRNSEHNGAARAAGIIFASQRASARRKRIDAHRASRAGISPAAKRQRGENGHRHRNNRHALSRIHRCYDVRLSVLSISMPNNVFYCYYLLLLSLSAWQIAAQAWQKAAYGNDMGSKIGGVVSKYRNGGSKRNGVASRLPLAAWRIKHGKHQNHRRNIRRNIGRSYQRKVCNDGISVPPGMA